MSKSSKLREELDRALASEGRPDAGGQPLHEALRAIGHRAAKSDAIPEMLRAVAALEARGRLSTLAAARRINQLMGSDDGRTVLAESVGAVLADYPDSGLLTYIRVVTLAKSGGLEEAQAILREELSRRRRAHALLAPQEMADNQRAFGQLTRMWRVVDMIARDEVAWSGAAAPADDDEALENLPSPVEPGEDDAPPAAEDRKPRPLVFTEDLIQTRRQDDYLAACVRAFESAAGFSGRLAAVKAMFRQGLRRLPDYSEAYALAREHYDLIRPEWTALVPLDADASAPVDHAVGPEALRTVRAVLPIAITLGRRDDVVAIQKFLFRLMRSPDAGPALWHAARALASTDAATYAGPTAEIIRQAGRRPEKKAEIESFFAWACEARQYDAAHELFRSLPERFARGRIVSHYIRILQRCGRHEEARQLVSDVNATNLSDPRKMCPFMAWSLVQREGELSFLAETAEWFSRIPQPRDPKGVVFVLPRDVNQLRRYPLVALMELKRQGWAVISLVEGLLPAEPTGVAELDRFTGSMLLRLSLSPEAAREFEPIEGFVSDVSTGALRWNGIDLSHQLWEEAAVSRRRYSVEYGCPALQATLQRIVDWAELTAIVLHNARLVTRRLGIRGAFMSLSQSRLPDALPRFYCERFGDPDDFFCLHSANGYENYFRNFASPISTRMAVRNMTANAQLRTASFPVASELEDWRAERREDGRAMLERVQDVAKVNRSAATPVEKPAEALAAMARVRQWRAEGGKVVCAFGKIVCDLAVPRDGGPAHADMKDWLNHTIESVRGSNTMLLVKPHPHELRNEIATFLTEQFEDLIENELPENVLLLGHRWFNIAEISEVVDLGVLYNGTTAIEFGTLGKPVVLCSNFAPIDYPVGHPTPRDREHYRRMLRFEEPAVADDDLQLRSAAWLHFVGGDAVTVDYRYHARSVTNRRVYPPWWFGDDIERFMEHGDPNVVRIVDAIVAKRAAQTA